MNSLDEKDGPLAVRIPLEGVYWEMRSCSLWLNDWDVFMDTVDEQVVFPFVVEAVSCSVLLWAVGHVLG